MLSEENYRYSYFTTPKGKAYVSYGAGMVNNDFKELYYVTLTPQAEGAKDLIQLEFQVLREALNHANRGYGQFDFTDMRHESKEGCDSCDAH